VFAVDRFSHRQYAGVSLLCVDLCRCGSLSAGWKAATWTRGRPTHRNAALALAAGLPPEEQQNNSHHISCFVVHDKPGTVAILLPNGLPIFPTTARALVTVLVQVPLPFNFERRDVQRQDMSLTTVISCHSSGDCGMTMNKGKKE
jgi:hypothetical protein